MLFCYWSVAIFHSFFPFSMCRFLFHFLGNRKKITGSRIQIITVDDDRKDEFVSESFDLNIILFVNVNLWKNTMYLFYFLRFSLLQFCEITYNIFFSIYIVIKNHENLTTHKSYYNFNIPWN